MTILKIGLDTFEKKEVGGWLIFHHFWILKKD